MAKKVKGRKRHIVTDTEGSLLVAHVQTANVQDNHGAVSPLRSLRRMFPKLRHIFADRVYRGPKLLSALADLGPLTIEIVTRSQTLGSFKPEPRRWVVERTFAWLHNRRRLLVRTDRRDDIHEGFLALACCLICWRRLETSCEGVVVGRGFILRPR